MSEFLDQLVDKNLSTNGYQKLPGGLIIQWGTSGSMSGSPYASVSVTFPIPFPTACFSCVAMSTGAGVSVSAASLSTTGFTPKNSSDAASPARWIAIGH